MNQTDLPELFTIDCTPTRPYSVAVAIEEGLRLKELYGSRLHQLLVEHDYPWPKWKRQPKDCPNCGHPLDPA